MFNLEYCEVVTYSKNNAFNIPCCFFFLLSSFKDNSLSRLYTYTKMEKKTYCNDINLFS